MSKLKTMNKDELLTKLDEWFGTVFDYGENEDTQAYNQIKEIIRQHFGRLNKKEV